jgi:hypothetical protein
LWNFVPGVPFGDTITLADGTARKVRNMGDKPNPIEIQKALGGVDYPASAEDLLNNAEQSGADKSVLEVLRKLPKGNYDSPADVSKAVADSA